MPVSQVTVECPCCGRQIEVILVGSAHTQEEPDWAENAKPKRKRRSRTEMRLEREAFAERDRELADGDGPVRE